MDLIKFVAIMMGVVFVLFVMLQIDSLHAADWSAIAVSITPVAVAIAFLGIAAGFLTLYLRR